MQEIPPVMLPAEAVSMLPAGAVSVQDTGGNLKRQRACRAGDAAECQQVGCVKFLKKERLTSHMRQCRQTADPTAVAASGTATHVDASGWMFLVNSDGMAYCGRAAGTTDRTKMGCRRVLGADPRTHCNASAQSATCHPHEGCMCGANAPITERRTCQRCTFSEENARPPSSHHLAT